MPFQDLGCRALRTTVEMGVKARMYVIYIPCSGALASRYGRPTEAQGAARRRKMAASRQREKVTERGKTADSDKEDVGIV